MANEIVRRPMQMKETVLICQCRHTHIVRAHEIASVRSDDLNSIRCAPSKLVFSSEFSLFERSKMHAIGRWSMKSI